MGSFENADGEGGQEAVSLPKAFGPLSPQAGVAETEQGGARCLELLWLAGST